MTAVAASTAGLVAADFRFTKPALPDRAAAAPRADEQLAKDVRQAPVCFNQACHPTG